ncbi:hypothetical protein E4U30_000604 [Claviceps sp. LM220 group G6]|nr:hypothetical protein E4U30_000604 [Claviceps sp. LM220 group G6]
MAYENARLPLPRPRHQPVQPLFAPSGPSTAAPFTMTFTAHASRARNIGLNRLSPEAPATNINVMEPMSPRSLGNVTTQTQLTAAALAQVKHLADPGDIPQYPIDGPAPPCQPDCLDWVLHWVEDNTRPGWHEPETHDELGAGAGCFGPEEYESESSTYWSEMELSEEDEPEKVEDKKEFFVSWSKKDLLISIGHRL